MDFNEINPSREDCWRSIILFGRNVASYKFALAKSLFEIGQTGKTIVTLEELAEPYTRHLTEHLKIANKQTASPSSRFLDACRSFNSGDLSKDELIGNAVRLGFNNVIDAFHNVNRAEVPFRFYEDERSSSVKGIRLTDHLLQLLEDEQSQNLPHEIEARWRLVETAWELNVPILVIGYNSLDETLFAKTTLSSSRRQNITSCRSALNGYQQGKCFYCSSDISIIEGAENLAQVDHFFPHILKTYNVIPNIDGVWNLVLACWDCNSHKSAKVPAIKYLKRLHARNEYLIGSHHPLREILINQTGKSAQKRGDFLNKRYDKAVGLLIHRWEVEDRR